MAIELYYYELRGSYYNYDGYRTFININTKIRLD